MKDDGGMFLPLIRAVILQAVADAKNFAEPERQLDAVLFLTGDDIPLWLEAAGMPFVDAMQFVTGGRARQLRRWRVRERYG